MWEPMGHQFEERGCGLTVVGRAFLLLSANQKSLNKQLCHVSMLTVSLKFVLLLWNVFIILSTD